MSKTIKLSEEEKLKINLIVENIENVNNVLELEKLIQSTITLNDLSNAYKKVLGYIKNCISEERYFFKIGDLEKISIQHEKKLRLKILLGKLKFMKQQLTSQINLKEKNVGVQTNLKSIIISNIKALDYFYSLEDKELFLRYLQTEDYESRIQILEKLRQLYLTITINNYRLKKETFFEISSILMKENFIKPKSKKNKKAINFYLKKSTSS